MTMEHIFKGARDGDKANQYTMGLHNLYECRDYAEAVYWLEKSAEQGYESAYLPLAKLFYEKDSKGIQTDYTKALHWCEMASQFTKDDNQEVAMMMLGDMYYHGKGTKVNYQRAADLYKQASEIRLDMILRY